MNAIPIWELSPRSDRICSWCKREFPTITETNKHERDCEAGKEYRAAMRRQADNWMVWAREHEGELR